MTEQVLIPAGRVGFKNKSKLSRSPTALTPYCNTRSTEHKIEKAVGEYISQTKPGKWGMRN